MPCLRRPNPSSSPTPIQRCVPHPRRRLQRPPSPGPTGNRGSFLKQGSECTGGGPSTVKRENTTCWVDTPLYRNSLGWKRAYRCYFEVPGVSFWRIPIGRQTPGWPLRSVRMPPGGSPLTLKKSYGIGSDGRRPKVQGHPADPILVPSRRPRRGTPCARPPSVPIGGAYARYSAFHRGRSPARVAFPPRLGGLGPLPVVGRGHPRRGEGRGRAGFFQPQHDLPSPPRGHGVRPERRLALRFGEGVDGDPDRLRAGAGEFRDHPPIRARRLARDHRILRGLQHDLGRAHVPPQGRGRGEESRPALQRRRTRLIGAEPRALRLAPRAPASTPRAVRPAPLVSRELLEPDPVLVDPDGLERPHGTLDEPLRTRDVVDRRISVGGEQVVEEVGCDPPAFAFPASGRTSGLGHGRDVDKARAPRRGQRRGARGT